MFTIRHVHDVKVHVICRSPSRTMTLNETSVSLAPSSSPRFPSKYCPFSLTLPSEVNAAGMFMCMRWYTRTHQCDDKVVIILCRPNMTVCVLGNAAHCEEVRSIACREEGTRISHLIYSSLFFLGSPGGEAGPGQVHGGRPQEVQQEQEDHQEVRQEVGPR